MRRLLILLPLLLLASNAWAQQLRQVVPPSEDVRVTDKLIFIFDCSTSMGEQNRFTKAIANLKSILNAPIDDGMFTILTFNTDGYSGANNIFLWDGVKSKKTPKGWAKIPSVESVKAAEKWLDDITCVAWTNIVPVFEAAFVENKDKENLTIILFSDGNNTFPNWNGEKPTSVGEKLEVLQKERVKQKKDKIRIFVFGLGVDQNVHMLSTIAKVGGGGYYTNASICKKCENIRDQSDVAQEHQEHEAE